MLSQLERSVTGTLKWSDSTLSLGYLIQVLPRLIYRCTRVRAHTHCIYRPVWGLGGTLWTEWCGTRQTGFWVTANAALLKTAWCPQGASHTPQAWVHRDNQQKQWQRYSLFTACAEKYLAAPHLGTSEAKVLTGAQFLKETAGDINAVVVPSVITYGEDREA